MIGLNVYTWKFDPSVNSRSLHSNAIDITHTQVLHAISFHNWFGCKMAGGRPLTVSRTCSFATSPKTLSGIGEETTRCRNWVREVGCPEIGLDATLFLASPYTCTPSPGKHERSQLSKLKIFLAKWRGQQDHPCWVHASSAMQRGPRRRCAG